ncbi:MAG: hypothetical protein Kow0032_01700 [Methyloligellaceae bacterium]
MSKSAAHLRLVASNEDKASREELARRFRETMTEHIRAHTEGTNVNSKTLLATDYLNHFNEAIMLLQMLPSAPAEMAADLAKWRHESYEEHFTRTGFRDKGLAIAGYRHAPAEIRAAFDSVTGEISTHLSTLLGQVREAVETGATEAIAALCDEHVPVLQAKIEEASAIVNGEADPCAGASGEAEMANAGAHQAAVDALFD